MPNYKDLILIFNQLFDDEYQTILVKGESEPIYLPKDESHSKNQIIFANGYFSSALHEIAHWCVAGRDKWGFEDFGYWYKPDGRTELEQKLFEQVEIKPQALEMCFSYASGLKFNFSADNLSGEIGFSKEFEENVKKQVLHYIKNGFPKRANTLIKALQNFYKRDKEFELFKNSISSSISLA